jgi:hypothetical protein
MLEKMDEHNGGPSRLDRMEGLMQLRIDDHLKFDDENKRLLTAQILLTDAQKRTDERMDRLAAVMTELAEVSAATDARMTILIDTVGEIVRKRGDAP